VNATASFPLMGTAVAAELARLALSNPTRPTPTAVGPALLMGELDDEVEADEPIGAVPAGRVGHYPCSGAGASQPRPASREPAPDDALRGVSADHTAVSPIGRPPTPTTEIACGGAVGAGLNPASAAGVPFETPGASLGPGLLARCSASWPRALIAARPLAGQPGRQRAGPAGAAVSGAEALRPELARRRPQAAIRGQAAELLTRSSAEPRWRAPSSGAPHRNSPPPYGGRRPNSGRGPR
jgi:hypothetical protein